MLILLLFAYYTMFLECTMCYRILSEDKIFHNNHNINEISDQPTQGKQDAQSSRLIPSLDKNVILGPHSVKAGLIGTNVIFTAGENGKNEITGNRRSVRQSDFLFDEDNAFNNIVVPNFSNRPNRPIPNIPNVPRTTTQRITTSTIAIPGMATARSPCEDLCQATTQFDPICGDNNVTYTNIYWLRCAQRCGKNVQVQYTGACPRVG